MKTEKIKEQIEKISRDFDLKYNLNWFNLLWISKRQARYLEYLGMCFDPIYTRFGNTIKKRIENIEKFESSKEFKKIKNEYSGQVITKSEVAKGIKNCRRIKDFKLKNELLNLYKKILNNLKEDNLALLTETINKKHKDILLNSILFHEWIHLLLIKNKIFFKLEKNWKYNEGLVTYLEYYSQDRLNFLESTKKKVKYPSQKIYFVYAIKFRELLKNANNGIEKKNILLNLVKSLS